MGGLSPRQQLQLGGLSGHRAPRGGQGPPHQPGTDTSCVRGAGLLSPGRPRSCVGTAGTPRSGPRVPPGGRLMGTGGARPAAENGPGGTRGQGGGPGGWRGGDRGVPGVSRSRGRCPVPGAAGARRGARCRCRLRSRSAGPGGSRGRGGGRGRRGRCRGWCRGCRCRGCRCRCRAGTPRAAGGAGPAAV